MDLFTFAAIEAEKKPVAVADAQPLQPAHLTCGGCGCKSGIVTIPTLVIPERLWQTYVESMVGWKGDCRRCQPYLPGESTRKWQPEAHGLKAGIGVRMNNDDRPT